MTEQPLSEPPSTEPVSEVAGDTALQSVVLEDLVGARNYRRWLVDLALPHLGEDPLEVGSGLGHYAADWSAAGVQQWTASEADAQRLEALRDRFDGDPVVRVRVLAVPIEETGAHSAVVAYNVLEHIPDDVAALRTFGELLRPGGRVVLVVPAFPPAMSAFDRAIGHQRRYGRRDLRSVAEQAGLAVDVLHHVNCIGLLAWLIHVKAMGRPPQGGFTLWVFDRLFVPWLRRLEARVRPPFGQSLFLVARKP